MADPLARAGVLTLGSEDGLKNTIDVGIKQLQVEQVNCLICAPAVAERQDTAKSSTIAGRTHVDLNRAGTGLMEIVTEPHMR